MKELPAIFCHVVTDQRHEDADGNLIQRKQYFMFVPEWVEFFNELQKTITLLNNPTFTYDPMRGTSHVEQTGLSETTAVDPAGDTHGAGNHGNAGTGDTGRTP